MVNPKRYTGIDRYLKYIILLDKLVQLLVRYWLYSTQIGQTFHSSEKLYGAEVINSFLWNGATDKPYATRIAWSDINPPQKEYWLGLCKNMAAIMWSIWRLFATLGYIWEVTTLEGPWIGENPPFIEIKSGKWGSNPSLTLQLKILMRIYVWHWHLHCRCQYIVS